MNEKEQKEFLDGILNYGKHIKENDINLTKIFKEVNENLNLNKINKNEPEIFDQDGYFNMDLLFEYSKQIGVEPIDFVAYCFDKVQSLGSFSHLGQTVDFSNATDTLNKFKKQFEEYKKSEDINNF